MSAPAFLLEVMDKEPSVLVLWGVSLLLGVGGLLLSRYKYWLALVVVAIALILAWAQVSELHDPSVGPNIVREAGYSYLVQSYVASAIAIVLPSVGAFMRWRRGA